MSTYEEPNSNPRLTPSVQSTSSPSSAQFASSVLEWDRERVSRWISYLGFSRYAANFHGKLFFSFFEFSFKTRLPFVLQTYIAIYLTDYAGFSRNLTKTHFLLDNNITGEVLVHLDQSDLSEIGVSSVGHRLRILKSIYNIVISQDILLGPDSYIPPSKYC